MFGASAIVCSALLSLVCDQVASLQIPLHGIANQKPALSGESEKRPRQLHGRFLQVTGNHFPNRGFPCHLKAKLIC